MNNDIWFWFLLFSPLTLVSVLTVNKEIISLFVVAVLMLWLNKRLLRYFFISLFLSYAVRWQLTLFILAVGGAFFVETLIKINRKLILLGLLVSASVSYYLLSDLFQIVTAVAFNNVEEVGRSGVFTKLNRLQGETPFGYVIAFLPKTLQLNFGLISGYYKFFDLTAAHNNVIMFLHSFLSMLLFCTLTFYKKIKFNNDLFFVMVIYLIIFSLSPIYSTRYFYPVFVLAAVLLSTPSRGESC